MSANLQLSHTGVHPHPHNQELFELAGILFWGTGIRGNQDVIDRNILAVLWLLTTLSVFFYSNQSISGECLR